jgi:hypothetical protein
MTDTTISTDPATLRQAAYGIAQSYPAIADILYTIAAEKEAQAAPPAGDPPEYLEYAIWQALTDLEEGATNTDRSRVAISAITAAGYAIVPRAPKTEAE